MTDGRDPRVEISGFDDLDEASELKEWLVENAPIRKEVIDVAE
ncbi:hypothetical protein [Natranaeroarchaeum aerophilus]|nr:hypothetical protein [Natranaeroarchaeum aerophilus]